VNSATVVDVCRLALFYKAGLSLGAPIFSGGIPGRPSRWGTRLAVYYTNRKIRNPSLEVTSTTLARRIR